jgi:phospholipid/cholesterol/gamma-HCH transport system substrate-binding protein
MAVQYRGFTIGSVQSFRLNDNDDVDVIFTIHEEHADRVRAGSLVELVVSPIGLGNQFLFHAGKGDRLEEGAFVAALGTARARELIALGAAAEPQRDDSISVIMNRANSILDEVNQLLANVNVALGPGTDTTEVGQIVGSIQRTLAGVEDLPNTVDQLIAEVWAELRVTLVNVNDIIAELNQPDGLLYTILDTDREVYTSLVQSLGSVTGILDNLDRTTAFIPSQLPQIAGLITEVRITLRTVEDLLIAVANNPLLRGGVPERPEHRATGPRNIRF